MFRRVAILLICLAGHVRAGDDARPLDLRACYDLALGSSESIGIAASEWRAAEARYRQTRDTLAPAVSLLAGEELQNDRSGSESGQFAARLRAEQTLYSGFRLTRLAEARETEGRAAKLDETRSRELLYLDVSDAFHLNLLYESDLVVLHQLVEALEQLVAELEKRLELGRSRRADLLNAKTDLAEARVDEESTRGQFRAARELLAFLINRPADSIQLTETSPFPATPELETRLAAATLRADVLAGEARVEASQRDLAAARAERKPQVAAEGNVYLYEDPDQEQEWNVMLTFELPIFDEGVIRSRAQEKLAQVHISTLNLSAVRRRAESEVRNAYIAFTTAVAQRGRLDEAESSAAENYEVQKKDYELGRASQLDTLNALAQLQRLRRRQVAAEVAARASLVRLHVAAGEVAP
ncbi:MAG: TolC family protein [bacterium]